MRWTGTPRQGIDLTIESGGLRDDQIPPGSTTAAPPHPLFDIRPGDLRIGTQYWFVTACEAEGQIYPQFILRYWPADSVGLPAIVPQAVAQDAYRWHPEFHREADLTIGWQDAPRDTTSLVRAWRDHRLLWETKTNGGLTHRLVDAWSLSRVGQLGYLRPPGPPDTEFVLLAETRNTLPVPNEFGLGAGPWRIQTLFDALTGRRVAARVRADIDPNVERVYRAYDPISGRARYERIQDFLAHGGKPVGVGADSWLRRIERDMDPKSGRILNESVRAYDDGFHAPGISDHWRPVEHDPGLAAGPPKVSTGP